MLARIRSNRWAAVVLLAAPLFPLLAFLSVADAEVDATSLPPELVPVSSRLDELGDGEAAFADWLGGDGGVSAATVFPPDDRFYVTNTTGAGWRSITLLLLFDSYGNLDGSCSGAMLNYNVVLTAAHCVYGGGAFEGGVLVVPGANAYGAPFGKAWASSVSVPQGWTTTGGQYDPGMSHPPSPFDFALVYLDGDPFQSKIGPYLPLASLDDAYLKRLDVEIATAGYPGDKPENTMWATSTGVFVADDTYLYTDMDIYSGQSGSPIFTYTEDHGVGFVISVVAGGNASFNRSVRFTDTVVTALTKFCANHGCTFTHYFLSGGNAPTPTPTKTSTPTLTPTPTRTASPTPSPTATPPPANRPFRSFLPALSRE